MMIPALPHKIGIRPAKIRPRFTNIGYGNPRYNSMVVCPDSSVLISCGPTLRRVDLKNDAIVMSRQIGYSQIFQIIENPQYVVVVNFDGLVTLLSKCEDYQTVRQFYARGKEIRHSSINKHHIAFSCELNDESQECFLEVYSLQDILDQQPVPDNPCFVTVEPRVRQKGNYYYPELVGQVEEKVILIEFHDPNPKGRQRRETAMQEKLPVTHRILEFSLATGQFSPLYDIKAPGEILCASQNQHSGQIYYLHQNKQLTVIAYAGGSYSCRELPITASSAPHCIESYRNGVIYCSKSKELTYLQLPRDGAEVAVKIPIDSVGVSGNFAIKASSIDPPALKPYHSHFYLFNENGLHYYCAETKQTFSQNCFDITNCGLSLNADGSQFAVADFGGNIYIFTTEETNTAPVCLRKTTLGIPVRTLTWCHHNSMIFVGCVGGSLFSWDGVSEQANFLMQLEHTINILRYFEYGLVVMGTSDGFVHLLHADTMEELYRFQAHFPIHYESELDRELFGSMKNYAEIWSVMAYPAAPPSEDTRLFYLVTCCEDQTEKVFCVRIFKNGMSFEHEQLHHLRGHSLAVTSIDWKKMGKGLGEVYVSCSDDKVIRFRDPTQDFQVLHEIETTTIKEWHTLTYLCLEPQGHRVAVGSQNGYLFIFDIEARELLFGEKIHLGGIEGLDWVGNRLVTCSSDLCISVITL